MPTDLVPAEKARLAELERVVERGLQTFLDVGSALLEIREQRLYRQTHKRFEDYCRERFGFSDSRGRQLIAAARTVTAVTELGLPAPKTEREARELARQLRGAAKPGATPLEQHPLVAGLLPDIAGNLWRSFVESIRKHGLLQPIILYEEKILDGWQRYRALSEIGQMESLKTETYDGDEPFALFLTLNLVRKHALLQEAAQDKQVLIETARKYIAVAEAAKVDALSELAQAREAACGDEEVLAYIGALEQELNQLPWVEEVV